MSGDCDENVPLAMMFKTLDLIVNHRLFHEDPINMDAIWDVRNLLALQ